MKPADMAANRLGIQQQPQRQDSLAEQLVDLHVMAGRLGMYDAADWLWKAAFKHPGEQP